MSATKSAEPGRKRAYSSDIGWRIVWQRLGMNRNFQDIAAHLQIATSTAHRIFARFQETGEVDPDCDHSNDRSHLRKMDEHHELFLIALVAENPSVYLREICNALHDATGVLVSPSLVCNTLKRLGFSRKKASQIAKQPSVKHRAAFLAQAMGFSADFFVWVDESSSDNRSFIRQFGYSLRGMSPVCHRLHSRGQRLSAIAAIASDGLVGFEITSSSVNGSTFLDFIWGTLLPEMEPFDGSPKKYIVVMDNCSIHHTADVKQTLEDAGILVFYLPPYSRDLNPIEEAFSYIKYYLKDHDELQQVMGNPKCILQAAFQSITPEQCTGWISHCGYC